MDEEEVLEEFELADGVVCRPGCLGTLSAKDSDADVRCTDHVDVVGAVAYGQGVLLGVSLLDPVHDVCFLVR